MNFLACFPGVHQCGHDAGDLEESAQTVSFSVCVCVAWRLYVSVCVCARGRQRSASPSCSLTQGLSLVWNSPSRLDWQHAPGIHSSLSPQHCNSNGRRTPHRPFCFFGSRNQIRVLMLAQPTLRHLSLSPDSFLLLSVPIPTPHPAGNPSMDLKQSLANYTESVSLWGNVEPTLPSLCHFPGQILWVRGPLPLPPCCLVQTSPAKQIIMIGLN